jgi:hypothetical protein
MLVPVAECDTCRDDRSAEDPDTVPKQLRREGVQRCPVGQRYQRGDVEPSQYVPAGKATEDPVDETQHHHRVQEDQGAVENLLEHTGVQRQPKTSCHLLALALQADWSHQQARDEGDHESPHEDEPHLAQAAEREAVSPECMEASQYVVRPERAQEEIQEQGADQRR